MLRRAYQLRRFVDQWTNENRNDVKIVKIRLTEDEWELILLLGSMLRTFYEITLVVSRTTNASVQTGLIVFNALYDHLDSIAESMRLSQFSGKALILTACEKAIRKLRKYYARTINEGGRIYNLANILDPTSKLSLYEGWDRDENFEETTPEAQHAYTNAARKQFLDYFRHHYDETTYDESQRTTSQSFNREIMHQSNARKSNLI